jgi:large subunit ribosomal protein L25
MKAVKIVAQPREVTGAGARRLRHSGVIPAVVYGAGKETRNIQLSAHDFDQALKGHMGEHMLMDLEIGGDKPLKVLLKETQHHPVSHKIIHADFNEISMTKKLRVETPIKLVGEPVGVTQQGGILEPITRSIEVECLPADIVESFTLDVSALNIGESLLAAAIQLDKTKYTILTSPDQAIVKISAPKAEEEVAPVAAEAGVGEPEVITEKKVEGEEGEEGAEEGKKEGKGEGKKEAAAKGGDAKKEAAKPEGKKEAKPEAKAEGKKAK